MEPLAPGWIVALAIVMLGVVPSVSYLVSVRIYERQATNGGRRAPDVAAWGRIGSMSTASPTSDGRPTSQPVVRRSMGTWRSLIISMALLGLAVAVWLALVPRVERVEQPAVDVATTTRQVARETRTPLRLADVGGDWKATSVRVEEPRDGVRVLHAGYHRLPDSQRYVAMLQTLLPTAPAAARAWVDEQYLPGGGTVEAGGLTWSRATQRNPARDVLIGRAGANQLIVLVGTVGSEDLAKFAGSLRQVAVEASSGSSASPRPVAPSSG